MSGNANMDTVSFPLNFLHRGPVKYIGHISGDETAAFRLWVDFALSGSDFRPVQFIAGTDITNAELDRIDFENCPVMWQIKTACADKTQGKIGIKAFISVCLQQGILYFDTEGGKTGIRLTDFAKTNPQWFPGKQAKGGATKGINAAAKQANKIADSQLPLLFDSVKESGIEASQEQISKAHSLINQLRRALGEEHMDARHDDTLIAKAIEVIKEHSAERITEVCTYLVTNRENPKVDRRIPVILERFGTYRQD